EDWLTTDPALAKEFALDKAAEAMSRVSACAEAEDPSGGRGQGVDEGQVYRKLYEQGWPLKAVAYLKDGKARPKSETVKIEKRDFPEAEFRPPQGYRKASLGEVMFSGIGSGPGGGD